MDKCQENFTIALCAAANPGKRKRGKEKSIQRSIWVLLIDSPLSFRARRFSSPSTLPYPSHQNMLVDCIIQSLFHRLFFF